MAFSAFFWAVLTDRNRESESLAEADRFETGRFASFLKHRGWSQRLRTESPCPRAVDLGQVLDLGRHVKTFGVGSAVDAKPSLDQLSKTTSCNLQKRFVRRIQGWPALDAFLGGGFRYSTRILTFNLCLG